MMSKNGRDVHISKQKAKVVREQSSLFLLTVQGAVLLRLDIMTPKMPVLCTDFGCGSRGGGAAREENVSAP